MLPSKKQWHKWSLPSKYTALGILIGLIFGISGTFLSVFFWLNPKSQIEPIALPKPIFRSTPISDLSVIDVKEMIYQNGFFDSGVSGHSWSNPISNGYDNRYEIKENGRIVVDYATGLIWHRNGSNEVMYFADAQKYIDSLNEANFGGHSNWRLPTLEESMSLMDKEPNGTPRMHIDTVFNLQPWVMWTSDKLNSERIWIVHFPRGECLPKKDGLIGWVRAVR